MKSILTVAVGFALLLSCVGCSQREYAPTPPVAGDQEYGYRFTEVTGITQYVVSKGKEIAIKFRPDSDPQAVQSLQSLGADVLYTKADGKQMFLIGKLRPYIMRTPDHPGMAASQPYQEFTLRGWRVKN